MGGGRQRTRRGGSTGEGSEEDRWGGSTVLQSRFRKTIRFTTTDVIGVDPVYDFAFIGSTKGVL